MPGKDSRELATRPPPPSDGSTYKSPTKRTNSPKSAKASTSKLNKPRLPASTGSTKKCQPMHGEPWAAGGGSHGGKRESDNNVNAP